MSSHRLGYFSVRKSAIFIPPISFPPKQEMKIQKSPFKKLLLLLDLVVQVCNLSYQEGS